LAVFLFSLYFLTFIPILSHLALQLIDPTLLNHCMPNHTVVVGNPWDAAVSDEKGNWPFGG